MVSPYYQNVVGIWSKFGGNPPPAPPSSPVSIRVQSNQNSTPEQNSMCNKEVKKVGVILVMVAFLGIGYIARFAITMDEITSTTIQLIQG